MQILLNITTEQFLHLAPHLNTLGIDPSANLLLSVDWERPRLKQSIYQLLTDDDLHELVAQFNQHIATMGLPHRLKTPGQLPSVAAQWKALNWLNTNAGWSEQLTLNDTWLNTAPDLQAELENHPGLLA